MDTVPTEELKQQSYESSCEDLEGIQDDESLDQVA